MSNTLDEAELPLELTAFQAVEAAYPAELTRAHEALQRGLAVMVECDKELVPYFYRSLRDRLKQDEMQCIYLDGRPNPNQGGGGAVPQGMMQTIIAQLRDAVRGSVEKRVVVLPHLDLLTTSTGGLTSEAREVIPLLYENPYLLWIGFKDPSFPLPKVIENLFPIREQILGIPRDRLRYLITQREARKFGKALNPFALYKHVSGVNAARLRRLLESIRGEDYPEDSSNAWAQLRRGTLQGGLEVPDVHLTNDIGGYKKVKERIQKEILDILLHKDELNDTEQIAAVEKLVPKGMIFLGPPGTGKTLFAKAMASSLGAAIQVVSGPEIKSKWVGESEENIRRLFVRARQSAPSIIVFDELDSIAPARGSYMGSSGVEHSMVNQLLTELDGFRSNEMVFVVGTTNFVESLDPALLRPGRFEFKLNIPFPNSEDRLEIFKIYDRKLGLQFSEDAFDFAIKRTRFRVEGSNSMYTGDHIYAMCRAIARRRIREQISGATEPADLEAAIEEYADRPELTEEERFVVATHEAGHAIVGLHCEHVPAIDRISIRGDIGGALGYVSHADPKNRYIEGRAQLLDTICSLMGGREAEALLLDDMYQGAVQDLHHATKIARFLVESLGLGNEAVGIRQYKAMDPREQEPDLSEETKQKIERSVLDILETQRDRASGILTEHREELIGLRDLLLEKEVIDRKQFGALGLVDPHGRTEGA